jgi:hypothetical protein
MVDDISEARDISGRSEGPTANLTESKTDENLWYVIQKIRQIAAYLLFFLMWAWTWREILQWFFCYFFYRASVLSEVQTSRNSQLPASKNLIVLGKKTEIWFDFCVKIHEKCFLPVFIDRKKFHSISSVQDRKISFVVKILRNLTGFERHFKVVYVIL